MRVGWFVFYLLLLHSHTSSRAGHGVTMTPVPVMLIHAGTFRQADRSHPRTENFNFIKHKFCFARCAFKPDYLHITDANIYTCSFWFINILNFANIYVLACPVSAYKQALDV